MASRIIALLYFIQASEVMYICFDISWAGCLVLNFVMAWDMGSSVCLCASQKPTEAKSDLWGKSRGYFTDRRDNQRAPTRTGTTKRHRTNQPTKAGQANRRAHKPGRATAANKSRSRGKSNSGGNGERRLATNSDRRA